MKVNRKEFLNNLTKVQPGLASKEIIEQSTSFVFQHNHLIAYNDEIAVSLPVNYDITGAVLSKELFGLFNKLKNKEVTIEIKDNEFILKAGKLKAGVRLEQEITIPTDFMEIELNWVEIPEQLMEGLKICAFSVAKESISPLLNNIHVIDDIMESSDNWRITRYSMGEAIFDEILIPEKAARNIVKYDIDYFVHENGWIHFKESDSGLIFSTRTFEENYPDLSEFMEIEGTEMKLPSELIEILDRSEVFSSDLISVSFKKGKGLIRSENENGWVTDPFKISNKKLNISFQVNAKILKDILRKTRNVIINENSMKFFTNEFEHAVSLHTGE